MAILHGSLARFHDTNRSRHKDHVYLICGLLSAGVPILTAKRVAFIAGCCHPVHTGSWCVSKKFTKSLRCGLDGHVFDARRQSEIKVCYFGVLVN